ncbi:transmembrane protein 240-like [Cottoperca gobio]|uniref:Transmembrane protein 240-like n=1 Tax=Cottoperca gobio TaxID=56716 RepID=A0A6J2PPE3_COTGO|nr:transmembrane protein 240-like [Cottoperca gobio]
MNALLDRFHNFFLPLVRGEDGVCACTCGRHQIYHVVPYNGAKFMVDSNYIVSDIITQQKMNIIVGLLLGLCISLFFSLFLKWLDTVFESRLKYCRANHMNDAGFWSWMPKFSKTREFFRPLYPQHTEVSSGKTLHISQEVYHNVNDT